MQFGKVTGVELATYKYNQVLLYQLTANVLIGFFLIQEFYNFTAYFQTVMQSVYGCDMIPRTGKS